MNVRRNHRSLSAAEKKVFVDAILKLKATDSEMVPGKQSRYDDFVQVHKNAMFGPDMFMPMPHRGPLFFPWHRIMLRQFELALQKASGAPNLAIPYWDWSISGDSNPFTPDFMGGDGDAAQRHKVTIGPFAHSAGHFEVRVWDEDQGDPFLRREFGTEFNAKLPTPDLETSALAKVPYSPGTQCWEVNAEIYLHNPVHNWVGGNMAERTSPNDPIFFLHHCYIDLLWERWKQQHPTAVPYLPLSGVPGMDFGSTLVFNAQGKPAPWNGSWTVKDTISTADLGYTYG